MGLFNAMAPLVGTVWKHHVLGDGHHQEDADDEAEDFSRYAAPAFA
jgi:hypothetical protein